MCGGVEVGVRENEIWVDEVRVSVVGTRRGERESRGVLICICE